MLVFVIVVIIGCNDTSDAEYECLTTDGHPLHCLACVLKYNAELNNINISNSIRFLESLPNVEIEIEIVNEAMQFSNVCVTK